MDTDSLLQRKGAPQPQISEEIESVQMAYSRSPGKSICRAFTQLQIPCSTIHKVCIETCNFMHIKCSNCKPLSQKIRCDKKNFSDDAGQVRFKPQGF